MYNKRRQSIECRTWESISILTLGIERVTILLVPGSVLWSRDGDL